MYDGPTRALPAHGVWSRYTHHKCRCTSCAEENRRRLRLWRETGSTRESDTRNDPEDGA